MEDSKDRVIVKGLATPLVSSEAEALQYLFEVCLNQLSCQDLLQSVPLRYSTSSKILFGVFMHLV